MRRIFFLLFLIPVTAFAQEFTAELMWKLGRVSGGTLSPDGKYILYGVSTYSMEDNKGTRDLFIIPVTGGTPKKLVDSPISEFNEIWKKDGKTVAYISAELNGYQVWEVNIETLERKKITDVKDGLGSFIFSPDEKSILYTQDVKMDQSNGEKHSDLPKANVFATDDLLYRHWDNWHDYAYQHLFLLPLDGTTEGKDILKDEKFDSPLMPFGGLEQVCFSPDGKEIIYSSKKKKGKEAATSTNSDLYSYSTETGNTKNITENNKGYDTNPAFSADGKWMAHLAMDQDGNEADKNDIILKDVVKGTSENLTAKIDLTVNSFNFSADGKFIYFISPDQGLESIFEFDLKTKKHRKITSGDYDYNSISLGKGFIISSRTTMNDPAELFKVEIKDGKATQLTFTNKDLLANVKPAQIQKRWITTSDKKKMLVWVVLPPDFDKTKKYPALLYCQGGPQSTVSQFFSYRWNLRLMASKGYIVIAPNRRGLPSFGQEWNDDISKDWGGQVMDDYLAATDSLAKEPYVDKDKMGAVGASYGGYSVYYLAGIHNNRFKTFISHCGLFNMESWYGTTEELFFANNEFGGPFWKEENKKYYEKFSPHNFIKNWNTPMLVIHGERDFRVPYSQGMEAFQAAKLMGVDARMVLFPDENHWILKPQNAMVWQREFFEWLDKYLK